VIRFVEIDHILISNGEKSYLVISYCYFKSSYRNEQVLSFYLSCTL